MHHVAFGAKVYRMWFFRPWACLKLDNDTPVGVYYQTKLAPKKNYTLCIIVMCGTTLHLWGQRTGTTCICLYLFFSNCIILTYCYFTLIIFSLSFQVTLKVDFSWIQFFFPSILSLHFLKFKDTKILGLFFLSHHHIFPHDMEWK